MPPAPTFATQRVLSRLVAPTFVQIRALSAIYSEREVPDDPRSGRMHGGQGTRTAPETRHKGWSRGGRQEESSQPFSSTLSVALSGHFRRSDPQRSPGVLDLRPEESLTPRYASCTDSSASVPRKAVSRETAFSGTESDESRCNLHSAA